MSRRAAVKSMCHESSSPARKKIKREIEGLPIDECAQPLTQYFEESLSSSRSRFHDYLSELHYLQSGSYLIDYYEWRTLRPESLLSVLHGAALDDEDKASVAEFASGKHCRQFYPKLVVIPSSCGVADESGEVNYLIVHKNDQNILASPCSSINGQSGSQSTALVNNSEHGTQEKEIVERARQEASVLQKINTLKRQGLWSAKRLPKVIEPPRCKSHWDYVLEEMKWLAADFAAETKWKKAAGKKLSINLNKHFRDQEELTKKCQKEEQLKLRRIASSCGRMVKEWWQNVYKVIEYKQKSRLNEKRKKALDLHLNFIVDQTEKYSEWLTDGLHHVAKSDTERSASDEDFEPYLSSDGEDNEETIAEAEAQVIDDEVREEIAELEREAGLSLGELLANLPDDIRNNRVNLSADEDVVDSTSNSEEEMEDGVENMEDDESTLAEVEEEEQRSNVNYAQELHELQAEADIPIEELIKEYHAALEADDATREDDEVKSMLSNSDSSSSSDEDDSDDDEEESNKESSGDEEIDSEAKVKTAEESICEFDVDKKEKIQISDDSNGKSDNRMEETDRAFNELAATAESVRPTGTTLDTVHIGTPIPTEILVGTLREYQHVGLDWLATLYEKRLNGILADEMGLGKTIQTIALLSHLACERSVWGPHLIVVPTSVMLNWEIEFLRWAPAFKILTYFGSQKERKEKRKGWTKTNAFHVCITSYKLAIQDHAAFKRKKWKYLILDEAQNIKNFKSQRWQTLLTFNSQRRLLLTGTPLQNSLMELWSLMHFLMPHVFQSHREFKEWFANPLTGMIEGSQEYNEQIVRRLHKVLRPFILRRLKVDVEKQMPKKYEHVVMCPLSKRQRYLYDDYMAQSSTKETLATGHFMSVINILMQLRKVCNHPNLFEERPTVSPFRAEPLQYVVPSLLLRALETVDQRDSLLKAFFPGLADMERDLCSFVRRRVLSLRPRRGLVQELRRTPLSSNVSSADVCLKPLERPFISRAVYLEVRAELSAAAASGNSLGSNASSDLFKPNLTATPLDQLPGCRLDASYCDSDVEVNAIDDADAKDWSEWRDLLTQRAAARRETLSSLERLSDRRCWMHTQPVYGRDLVEALELAARRPRYPCPRSQLTCLTRGFSHCLRAQLKRDDARLIWRDTSALLDLVSTPAVHFERMLPILQRFVFVVPPVKSSAPQLVAAHPPVSQFAQMRRVETSLMSELGSACALLHPVMSRQQVLFPEVRLIEYDCGKLQTLAILLRRLKSQSHRVLIFTQMTRMLDVLEQFLNFYGHRYLRLDGTTRVEQRQLLMERFNADARIFVFILSTRSGGLGVNLTGADTVIFYDSDWNPTMDAQAQDRCHRIGQTRDVHIYRLISERTIEENILKKANQKRNLTDLAIEGGNFTTDFFKAGGTVLHDLFNEPSGLDDLLDAATTAVAAPPPPEQVVSDEQVQAALENAEEESDRVAAGRARAEESAELAEFDESIPWDEQEARFRAEDDREKRMERELAALDSELSPIERYALQYLECQLESVMGAELNTADAGIDIASREWELEALKAMRDEEELRAELEEDDMLFCYGRHDMREQDMVYNCTENGRQVMMPVWLPPTPEPESPIYQDEALAEQYQLESPMSEAELPLVFMRRIKNKSPAKRARLGATGSIAHYHSEIKGTSVGGDGHDKQQQVVVPSASKSAKIPRTVKDEASVSALCQSTSARVYVPRSIFARELSGASRMRRTANAGGLGAAYNSYGKGLNRQTSQSGLMRSNSVGGGLRRPTSNLAYPGVDADKFPKWVAHEDASVQFSLAQLQALSLEAALAMDPKPPSQVANYFLAEYFVNYFGRARTYRGWRQIKNRVEMSANMDNATGSNIGAVGSAGGSTMEIQNDSNLGSGNRMPGGYDPDGYFRRFKTAKKTPPCGLLSGLASGNGSSPANLARLGRAPSAAANVEAQSSLLNAVDMKCNALRSIQRSSAAARRAASRSAAIAGGPSGLVASAVSTAASATGDLRGGTVIQRNPKHVLFLQEQGINVDTIVSPANIIKIREERQRQDREQQSSGGAVGAATVVSRHATPPVTTPLSSENVSSAALSTTAGVVSRQISTSASVVSAVSTITSRNSVSANRLSSGLSGATDATTAAAGSSILVPAATANAQLALRQRQQLAAQLGGVVRPVMARSALQQNSISAAPRVVTCATSGVAAAASRQMLLRPNATSSKRPTVGNVAAAAAPTSRPQIVTSLSAIALTMPSTPGIQMQNSPRMLGPGMVAKSHMGATVVRSASAAGFATKQVARSLHPGAAGAGPMTTLVKTLPRSRLPASHQLRPSGPSGTVSSAALAVATGKPLKSATVTVQQIQQLLTRPGMQHYTSSNVAQSPSCLRTTSGSAASGTIIFGAQQQQQQRNFTAQSSMTGASASSILAPPPTGSFQSSGALVSAAHSTTMSLSDEQLLLEGNAESFSNND